MPTGSRFKHLTLKIMKELAQINILFHKQLSKKEKVSELRKKAINIIIS